MFRIALSTLLCAMASQARSDASHVVASDFTTLSDPTKPYAPPEKPGLYVKAPKREQAIHLEMIFYETGHSFVIMNGKIYREGDLFNQQRITHIRKDRVILQNDERNPILFRWANISIKHRTEGDQK